MAETQSFADYQGQPSFHNRGLRLLPRGDSNRSGSRVNRFGMYRSDGCSFGPEKGCQRVSQWRRRNHWTTLWAAGFSTAAFVAQIFDLRLHWG